jgi:DNA-binding MarR family transcriptional regulator
LTFSLVPDIFSAMESPSADDRFVDSYVPYLCHRIEVLLPQSFHERLAGRGLTAQTWHTLAMLHDHGECSVGELVELTLNSQPTQTRIVDQLAANGHVAQVADGDRRRRVVRLTTSGRRLTKTLIAQAKKSEQSSLSALSDREQAQLLKLLSKITTSLESA